MPGTRPSKPFPSRERIKKRLEFAAAQSEGKRVTTPHFVLLVYAREGSERWARLGLVASRKIGNAVRRNRAKRLVREAFRETRDLWQPGIDLVVIVRRPLEKMKLCDVSQELRDVAPQVERRSRDALRDRDRRAGE